MAKKRTRETHEKRAREHSKQLNRAAKHADRVERNAKKREARDAGEVVPPTNGSVGVSLTDPRHPAYEPAGAPPEKP
jgi:hypothetical protein